MHSLSDVEQRELYAQAFRMAYSECGSLMDCLVGLRFAAEAGNDDKVAQIAKDGLAACQPILELLERLTSAFPEASREDAFLRDPKT